MHLPPLVDLLASMRVVALPLRTTFRSVDARELVLFEGPCGWGEFAPFKDHTLEHSAQWLAAAIEAAYDEFPAPVRSQVPVNAIVPMLPVSQVAAWVSDIAHSTGVSTFKLKCGAPDFADDIARITQVLTALQSLELVDYQIRIDINGAWSVDQAIERINRIAGLAGGALQYIEQPVASLADCALIREQVDVPIAIDEGVRLLADARLHVEAVRAAGDIAILKAIPLGGVQRSLAVASELQMPCVVSGSMDSSVGLAQGIALAAALPQLDYACGFLTGSLLAHDVVAETLLPEHGVIAAGRIAPSEDLLVAAAARVDSATQSYWRERLIACYKILEAA